MKPTIDISSVMSAVSLPKRNLEAMANYNGPKSEIFKNDFELPGYENISWRFMNALGIGHVQITLRNKQNDISIYRVIPVSASFLAVCTKASLKKYRLQFTFSLS